MNLVLEKTYLAKLIFFFYKILATPISTLLVSQRTPLMSEGLNS